MRSGDRPSPMKAANEVSVLLRAVLGDDRFPVDVETVAMDYSKKFADPIAKIVGESLDGFEGMLRPSRKKPAWHIIYNNDTAYRGRERFTLAHEFGHYLLHRRPLNARDVAAGLDSHAAESRSFACSPMERHTWTDAGCQIEEEADTFASYLLMPLDDYRAQVDDRDIDLDLLRHITGRYGVSLTAAVRKWIEFNRPTGGDGGGAGRLCPVGTRQRRSPEDRHLHPIRHGDSRPSHRRPRSRCPAGRNHPPDRTSRRHLDLQARQRTGARTHHLF